MPSINIQQPAASQDNQLYQLLYKFLDNNKREPVPTLIPSPLPVPAPASAPSSASLLPAPASAPSSASLLPAPASTPSSASLLPSAASAPSSASLLPSSASAPSSASLLPSPASAPSPASGTGTSSASLFPAPAPAPKPKPKFEPSASHHDTLMSAIISGLTPSELKKRGRPKGKSSVDSTGPSSSSLLPETGTSVDSTGPSSSSLLPETGTSVDSTGPSSSSLLPKPKSLVDEMIERRKSLEPEPKDTTSASEWDDDTKPKEDDTKPKDDTLEVFGWKSDDKKTDMVEDALKHTETTKEVEDIYGDDKAKDDSTIPSSDSSVDYIILPSPEESKIPGKFNEFVKFIEDMSDDEFNDKFRDENFKNKIIFFYRANKLNLKNTKSREVILKQLKELN